MNPKLIKYMKASVPAINPHIGNSMVWEHMQYGLNYINSVIQTIARGYPPGFTYEGMERVTPQEEYAELMRPRDGKSNYDLARNDSVMVRFKFKHTTPQGTENFDKCISIPYVSRGGLITLRGTKYMVSPVLSDRVISVDNNGEIFVRLIRDKLRFNRKPHYYYANGVQETIQVISSNLYKHSPNGKKSKPTIKANTTLGFYSMCHFGLSGMFEQYVGFKPIVVEEGKYNPDDYPSQDYVICRSIGVKPYTYKSKTTAWDKPTVHLIFTQEQYQTPSLRSLIADVFYCIDHFPFEMATEADLNDTSKWRVMLGQALWSSEITYGRLLSDITEHVIELDRYVDELMREKFYSIGLPVNTIYDLFWIIIRDSNVWLLGSSRSLNNLYRKEITVLNFLLFDITSMFTLMYYRIIKDAKQPKGLTSNNIKNAMKMFLQTQLALSRLTSTHGELRPIDYSGDNMLFGATIQLTPQNKTFKQAGASSDTNVTKDPVNFAHPSIMEITTHSSMSKAEPSGRTRINPHANILPNGTILRHENLESLLDAVAVEVLHQ